MEQAALITALKVGGVCIGGAALTVLCIWGCYKLYQKFWLQEKPLKIRVSDGELFMTYDDLKNEVGPCLKNSDGNNNETKSEADKKQEEKIKQLERDIRALQEAELIRIRKQTYEQQTEELKQTFEQLTEELLQLFTQLQETLEHQGNQRVYHQGNNPAPRGIDTVVQNWLINHSLDLEALQREGDQRNVPREERVRNWVNSHPPDPEDSASSTSSVLSVPVTENNQFQRWSQMTLEDKRRQECRTCGEQAQIITKKCGHPVLCLKCFNDIYPRMGFGKRISQCPVCDRNFDEEKVPIKIVLVE